MLPTAGHVIVKVGQKVNSTDVIGEAVIGRKHLIVDIARLLRISPRNAAACTKVKKGQKLAKDELIAETTGLFSREVKAPVEGRVVAMGGGKLVLETGGAPFELVAGIPGTVTEVIPDHGAIIRATGAVIQGVWGNGRLETGVMISIMDRADEVFDPNRLDVSIRGSIILGGYVDNPAVLKGAIELAVRGLILSSMSPALLPLAMQAVFPILLVDGFGSRPMNASAYKLLSTNNRRDIAINAETYDRLKGSRPEVFIPLPVSQEPPETREVEAFATGQTVRVINLIGPAQLGKLQQLNANPVSLPNGLRAKTAVVRLESGDQITVPLTNLEVLG